MINIEELDLNQTYLRKSDFSFSDFGVNTLLGRNPIKIIQNSTQQLSVYCCTHSNAFNKSNKFKTLTPISPSNSVIIFSVCFCFIQARCSHFGIRSVFRGLKVTIFKNSMLYSIYEFINKFQYQQNRLAQYIFKGLVVTMGYSMIYPFENIKLRMAADLEQQRYYDNIRDCIKKIKKHQGPKALYRGFSIASIHLISQFALIKTLINLRSEYSDKISNPLIFTGLFFTSFAAYQFLLYPLDTLKKNIQINGSLGHDDYNKNIRKAVKNLSFSNYFNGLPVRMMNSACYVILSGLIGRIGKQNKQ